MTSRASTDRLTDTLRRAPAHVAAGVEAALAEVHAAYRDALCSAASWDSACRLQGAAGVLQQLRAAAAAATKQDS